MGSPKLPIASLILLAAMLPAAAAPPSLSKPGCPSRCGNISIPFPFGTSPDCCLDESFLITCNHTHYNPPIPFLSSTNIKVQSIEIHGELRVPVAVASDCYNRSGTSISSDVDTRTWLHPSQFFISSSRNKVMVVGCDALAVVSGSVGKGYRGACVAFCNSSLDVINGSCDGVGCCEIPIPQGARDYDALLSSVDNHSKVMDFNPCGYAFVTEDRAFNFSSLDLKNLQNRDTFPVVLDWAVGNKTCRKAREDLSSYACRAEHSECHNSTNGQGYLCKCLSGYQGNPYLIDGCQDINECETSNPCNITTTCTNLPGNFSCPCPIGYEGDGLKNGTGCFVKDPSKEESTVLEIALGVSIGLLVLVLASSWIYWMLKKRKHIKRRELFFKQNGGIMLQRQLLKRKGSVELAKIFTAEDLKKATNNYEQSRIIGQGGYGTVYKGLLPDNRVVAIKKSKVSDQSQIEQFINEVVVLSQINHRNVVKLLGCCLETEVPLLVYEFITNGTLSDHIHNEGLTASLSWEIRLKIAAEAAEAVAYLHSATSPSIIHRDIKSTNILLDNSYNAKVSDFGASRLVPLDCTQLTTLVQGTLGYLDPEYFHSSQLTEKSDVYSFGVLLAELLTGERALSFDRPEKDRNLAKYFVSSMKEDCLFRILDKKMVNEGNFEQLKEVATLTRRCLRLKGEERPSMKEVAMELEGLLRMIERHPWVNVDLYPVEAEQLLDHNLLFDTYNGVGAAVSSDGCSTSSGYGSLKGHILGPLDDGR